MAALLIRSFYFSFGSFRILINILFEFTYHRIKVSQHRIHVLSDLFLVKASRLLSEKKKKIYKTTLITPPDLTKNTNEKRGIRSITMREQSRNRFVRFKQKIRPSLVNYRRSKLILTLFHLKGRFN